MQVKRSHRVERWMKAWMSVSAAEEERVACTPAMFFKIKEGGFDGLDMAFKRERWIDDDTMVLVVC